MPMNHEHGIVYDSMVCCAAHVCDPILAAFTAYTSDGDGRSLSLSLAAGLIRTGHIHVWLLTSFPHSLCLP